MPLSGDWFLVAQESAKGDVDVFGSWIAVSNPPIQSTGDKARYAHTKETGGESEKLARKGQSRSPLAEGK